MSVNNSNVVAKYIKGLRKAYKTGGVEKCRLIASYQFDEIDNMDNGDIICYFNELCEISIALAAHMYEFYTGYSNKKSDIIRKTITRQVRIGVEELREDEAGNNDHTTPSTRNGGDTGNDIVSLSELCFASLIINDEALIDEVFSLIGLKYYNDLSIKWFLKDFSRQISSSGENKRGILTTKFLSLIYTKTRAINERTARRIVNLYPEYSALVVGCYYMDDLGCLLRNMIEASEYFYFRHVVRSFPELTTDKLGELKIDIKSLMYKIIHDYPSSIPFYVMVSGLKTILELLIKKEKELDGINLWWNTIEKIVSEYEEINETEREFLRLYYYLKCIESDPYSFEKQVNHMALKDPAEDELRPYYDAIGTIRYTQQIVTEMIITYCPQNTITFLKWLGNWNYYKFNENERRFAKADPNDNGDSLIDRLAETFTLEQENLVFIYLNSSLRRTVQINTLLKKIYKLSTHQREDYLMVIDLFKPYRMLLRIKKSDMGFDYRPYQFKYDEIEIFRYTVMIRQKLEEYYEKNKNEKGIATVHFHVSAANVNTRFCPQIHLDYSEFLEEDLQNLNRKAIDRYLGILKDMETKQLKEPEGLEKIKNLPEIILKNADAMELGMAIVRYCCGLNNNADRSSFLKNLSGNPYYSKRNRVFRFGYLRNNKALKDFLKLVACEEGSFADKLFIYLNTVLRMNMTFDEFMSECNITNGVITIDDAFVMNELFCSGTVKKIVKQRNRNKVYVMPDNIYIEDKHDLNYILYTDRELKTNDSISFIISHYNADTNEIILEGNTILLSRQMDYFNVIAKSSVTLELSDIDKSHFNATVDFQSLKKMAYRLADYQAKAIGLRKDNFDKLTEYLKLLQLGNPWKFSTEMLPVKFVRKDYDHSIDTILSDIVRKYDIEFVIKLYFNTSFKSFISLEEFLGYIKGAEKLDQKALSLIAFYPLKLWKKSDRIAGSNIYLINEPILQTPYFSEDELYELQDYKVKRKQVILVKHDQDYLN